jgi:peptidoglycan hydrolase-like protein with peptidoglycan-binding domain
VIALQSALKTTGYTKINPNGVMTSSTIAALKSFQKKNKLSQNGTLDDATRQALISAIVEKA